LSRSLGAIVFIVLDYMAIVLFALDLPPSYATAGALLGPLIGFAAVAWAFVPDRKR
jgi:hypothetical protein